MVRLNEDVNKEVISRSGVKELNRVEKSKSKNWKRRIMRERLNSLI